MCVSIVFLAIPAMVSFESVFKNLMSCVNIKGDPNEQTPIFSQVSHEEPPLKEFAPVFIEEKLMLRKDMRMRELETWRPGDKRCC